MPEETASILITANNQATGPINNVINSLGGLKTIAPLAGAAIATYIGKQSFDAFKNFESAMTDSLNMFKKVSESQRSEMEKTARQLGKTYGVGGKKAAEAIYYLGSAGLDVKESQEALNEVLKFTATSTLETGQAAEVALTAMKNFGYGADEMGKVISRLELIESNAQVTTSQMADSFSYVAPVAKKAGVSLSEMGAMIGILGDSGIRGSKAGTTLRRAIVNLIKPTGQTAEALKEMGLSTNIYAENNADMMKTLEDVFTAMDKMNKADRQATSAKIFGTRAVAGMTSVLKENMAGIEDRARAINKDGEATRRWNNRQKTAEVKMKQLGAAVEDIKISIGAALAPVITKLATLITDKIIPALGKFWDWLGPKLQPVIDWLQKHGGTLIKVVLTPLAAVIKMLHIGMKNWIKYVLKPLTKWLGPKLSRAGKMLARVLKPLAPLMKPIKSLMDGLINAAKKLYHWVWGGSLVPALWKLVDVLNALLKPLRLAWKGMRKLWSWAGKALGKVRSAVGGGGRIRSSPYTGGGINPGGQTINVGRDVVVRADDPNEFRRKLATSGYRRR